jgi:putative transposase
VGQWKKQLLKRAAAAFTSEAGRDSKKVQEELLKKMDGKGRCMDNIFVERLWRSLKYEEVYLHAYNDVREAWAGVGRWLRFYYLERPHQVLDYQPPMRVYRTRLLERAA